MGSAPTDAVRLDGQLAAARGRERVLGYRRQRQRAQARRRAAAAFGHGDRRVRIEAVSKRPHSQRRAGRPRRERQDAVDGGHAVRGRAVPRMGKVDDGNTVSDWDAEEAKRQVSISTSLVPCEWKDHKINVLDTPGYFDFVGEVESALLAVDAMVCVVCAASGVEVGTEQAWAMAEKRSLPRAFFVNKMDRENASFERTLEQLKGAFGADLAVLQVPIGEAENFRGWVDLLAMEAWVKDGDKMTKTSVPDEVAAPPKRTGRRWWKPSPPPMTN